jgi:hypothetical protein
MIPVFPVYEEEGILEAFVRQGSITDPAERTVPTVNNNVPTAI